MTATALRSQSSRADKLLLERQNVEVLIRKFNVKNAEVAALTEATQTQIDGVQRANAAVTGADYSQFSHEEKMQAGLLVNMTLTLAQMINKELELDDWQEYCWQARHR